MAKMVSDINSKVKLYRYFYLFTGLICISVAFNLFLLPKNIVFGNVSGLSIIAKHIFSTDPSVFILICSLLLLIVSHFVLGKEKTKNSILGSILLPVFVKVVELIQQYFNFNPSDVLACAIFGGVLYGLGAGLVFKAGFTTGGTDIINQIISKYGKVSMGTALLMSDGLIVICGGVAFGLVKLMYSVITLYIMSIMTDRVMLGISDSKVLYVITKYDEDVKKFVMKELGHGITVFEGKGGFSKEHQKVLFCVVPTKEYIKLKEGIKTIDSDAFFVTVDSYESLGGEWWKK